jgi:surface protein
MIICIGGGGVSLIALGEFSSEHANNLGGMFAGERSFNQNHSSWDVSSVINMVDMFIGAAGFNQPLDEWDTSLVTNLERMFKCATSFNENL